MFQEFGLGVGEFGLEDGIEKGRGDVTIRCDWLLVLGNNKVSYVGGGLWTDLALLRCCPFEAPSVALRFPVGDYCYLTNWSAERAHQTIWFWQFLNVLFDIMDFRNERRI